VYTQFDKYKIVPSSNILKCDMNRLHFVKAMNVTIALSLQKSKYALKCTGAKVMFAPVHW